MKSSNSGGLMPLSQGGLKKYHRLKVRRRRNFFIDIGICGVIALLGSQIPQEPGWLFHTLSHPLRIQSPHFTPEFIPILVKIDKGGSELETIDWCKIPPNLLLDVETDEQDFISKFVFELVHDGLQLCAEDSIRGLEFQQDRLALPDHGLDRFGIVH